MRHYMEIMIHFMALDPTRTAALQAAQAVRSEVASMGQDDKSLREHFSKALATAVLSDAAPLNENSFKDISFFHTHQARAYPATFPRSLLGKVNLPRITIGQLSCDRKHTLNRKG
jgi:hypothetical protein